MNGTLEASIPAEELVLGGGAPQYDREFTEPKYLQKINEFDSNTIQTPEDLKQVAEQIIALPSIASKRWIFNQYDSMVGTVNASTNAPSAAAVVSVKGTSKGLVVTTDCNSRYVFADPYKGAMIAVSEAARNIVCSGGLPLGVTNCLNFGNPYIPELYYQFVNAVKGMGEACRKFDTPVTGGNVSFYNQNPDGPINPTPTIGMVGLLENIEDKMTLGFKSAGDIIYVLGKQTSDINSSEYLYQVLGVSHSPVPHFELEEEFALQQLVAKAIGQKLVESANDISEGGLFVNLCESGFVHGLGFDITLNASIRKDALLFGEGQSRVVVSVSADKAAAFEALVQGTDFEKIGVVSEGDVSVDGEDWGAIINWNETYNTAIENFLTKEGASDALSSL